MSNSNSVHENFCQFQTAAMAVVQELESNITNRGDILADKDLVLFSNTRIALEYLLTRVSSVRKLVLAQEIMELVFSLEGHLKVWDTAKKYGEVDLLPVVDVQDIHDWVQHLIKFSFTEFNPDHYGKESVFSSIKGLFRKD